MSKKLTPDAAKEFLAQGNTGDIKVDGFLDLRSTQITSIEANIVCDDLDASGTPLQAIRGRLQVNSTINLADCKRLETLPEKLKCGSLNLRDCTYLGQLPEKLDTWFLDLTGCTRFSKWPKEGNVQRGNLLLRNCIEVQQLPSWVGRIAQLDLAGCVQLESVPEAYQVTHWIDVGGTNISELPDSLGDVNLRWRGVPVSRRIAFEPESIVASDIIGETNAEVRRVMIERMGYLRFAKEANARSLDQDTDPGGQRELLFIELNDDEPLVGLSCSCPSTGRHYFLRVPPDTKTCHQAAAWLAGFDDPSKYKPLIET